MVIRHLDFSIVATVTLAGVLGCSRPSPPSESAQDITGENPGEQEGNLLFKTSPVTEVPNLAELPKEWALQHLRLKELQGACGQLFFPHGEWQADWIEGRVHIQTPQPATAAKPGVHVAYWTVHRADKDVALVEVPTVVGQPIQQAVNEIEAAGLVAMTVTRSPTASESAAPGVVLQQFPRSSQPLGPHSTVLLHVAEASPKK